jgi:hypothetical protein
MRAYCLYCPKWTSGSRQFDPPVRAGSYEAAALVNSVFMPVQIVLIEVPALDSKAIAASAMNASSSEYSTRS